MARRRSDPPAPEPKRFASAGEIQAGIRKLTRRLADIEALKGAHWRDPRIDDVQNRVRSDVLDIYGERSYEWREHEHFRVAKHVLRFNMDEGELQELFEVGLPEAIVAVRGLIQHLAEKLEDLSGERAPVVSSPGSRNVFIVHGHAEEWKSRVARFVEKLGYQPVILHEQPDEGRTIIEKLEAHARDACFALILLTADDVGSCRDAPQLNTRARQNVVLEYGYFLALLGRKRVCALYEESVELPSDLHGLLYKPLGDSWELQVGKELKAAGLDIDLNRLA